MNPTIDTLIFDLDGTILDTLPDLVVLTNQSLEQAGFPTRSHDEILSYVGNGTRALMMQAVPEGTGIEAAEAALAAWKENFFTYPNDLTKPYPQVVETLRELRARGVKLGVLSNKFEPGVLQIIEQCLPGLFDAVHGESPVIPRKPDPTGMLYTIKELGSEPQRCAYVGDSPSDIEAAHNAGVFAIGVSWGYHPVERLLPAKPDAMVDEFAQMLEFVSA